MGMGKSLFLGAVMGASVLHAISGIAQAPPSGQGTQPVPVPGMLPSVSQQMLDAAAQDGANWLQSNGNYSQTRFYPARQINTDNVAGLKPVFAFHTGVVESMETAPIVVNGILFLTTSFNHVFAIDAVTG